MTIEELKNSNSIILECISGSKAYGLNTAGSDTDIRGVFILPKKQFYGMQYVDQVNDAKNDIVYYELEKFVNLLAKNNPNILELLQMPADSILYQHPIFEHFKMQDVLSKLCHTTFVGYAYAQISKAQGLNKKIMNPLPQERLSVLDFCNVYVNKSTTPLLQYLQQHNMQQQFCGLAAVPQMHDCYNLFYNPTANYNGIVKSEIANEVALSSFEKLEPVNGLLFFNKDAYSIYCKNYTEYWAWVKNRNQDRYNNNISHGKNYDAKNIMHTYRLLYMAKDIATKNEIIVRRPEREFLLQIKSGAFTYDELLQNAETLKNELEILFEQSTLPAQPNTQKLNDTLIAMREAWYAT